MAQVVCGIPIGDDVVAEAKRQDLCAKQSVLLDVLKVPAVLDIPTIFDDLRDRRVEYECLTKISEQSFQMTVLTSEDVDSTLALDHVLLEEACQGLVV